MDHRALKKWITAKKQKKSYAWILQCSNKSEEYQTITKILMNYVVNML